MYVIITKPLLYVYGPFDTASQAKRVCESEEFKTFDVGEAAIRHISNQPLLDYCYDHKTFGCSCP